jgi:hypothetical protein
MVKAEYMRFRTHTTDIRPIWRGNTSLTPGSQYRYWDGSRWVDATARGWSKVQVKYWDGEKWVTRSGSSGVR